MQARALRTPEASDTRAATAQMPAQAPYLFADSVPFSRNFDFIAALEAFVDLAAVVLAKGRAAQDLEAEIAAAGEKLREHCRLLERLETQVAQTAADVLLGSAELEPFMQQTSDRVDEYVRKLCDSTRTELQSAFEARRVELEAAIAARHEAMLSAVQSFFLRSELELVSERVSIELGDQGYTARVTRQLEGEITVGYAIDVQHTPWAKPLRVAELAGDIALPIELRRSWLSRSLHGDLCPLGDYVIGHVQLEADELTLGLRKKRETSDTLTLRLIRYNDGVTGEVLSADGSDRGSDIPLDAVDQLVRLWSSASNACQVSTEARARVTDLSIGHTQALGPTGATRLVDQLVELYRPIVAELLDHGAASGELSLKRDLGDGRREERFVSLIHLVDKVSALAAEERARLSGLGLDRQYLRHGSGSIAVMRE